MKKFLPLILLAFFGLSLNAQVISSFPAFENFENGADDDEFFTGLASGWTIFGYNQSPNSGSPINQGVYSSSYACSYYFSSTSQTYDMETYAFQVGNYDHAKLSFYYANPEWSGDVDELKIGLRFTAMDDYTTVWTTTESHDEWTYVEVSLPVNNTHVQLQFTAVTHYGYGVYLDRMKVEAWDDDEYGNDFTVIDGSGVSSNLPASGYWNYTFNEFLYDYSYLPSPGSSYDRINSISFYYLGSTTTGSISGYNRKVDIYMKNVTRSNFSDNQFEPVSADDLVYSGYITGFAEGWITVELDRPFYYKNYSGTNLLIAIDDNTGSISPSTNTYFRGVEATDLSIRYASDDTNPDPFTITDLTGSLQSHLPNLMINYDQMMPATVPYYTDFDDDEFGTYGPWMIKNVLGEGYANWYFQGALGKSDYPGLATTSYDVSDHSAAVLAERLVRLNNAEQIKIEFNITVDGEGEGLGEDDWAYDYVMVFLAPASENWMPSKETYADDIPYLGNGDEWDLPYALHFGEYAAGTKLFDKDDETMSTIIPNPGPGQVYKLIFVWRNDYSQGGGTGAYIDNISITDANDDGVAQNDNSSFNVMPNPASDVIVVNGLNGTEVVNIYNTLGQVVKTAHLNNGESLSISDLTAGVYMLRSESSTKAVKFIVK